MGLRGTKNLQRRWPISQLMCYVLRGTLILEGDTWVRSLTVGLWVLVLMLLPYRRLV